MAALGASGAYARHLEMIRSAYQLRRDTLARAVAEHLPALGMVIPEGGWFLWLRLPSGIQGAALRAAAEAHGTSFLEGTRFFVGGGGEDRIRLAFSLFDPERLEEAARRLRRALDHLEAAPR
jgi:2-aminoadipate transaminase